MSKCINCNSELPEHAKFCPNCGAKQPVEDEYQQNSEHTANTAGDASEQRAQNTESQHTYTYGQYTENTDGYRDNPGDGPGQNDSSSENGNEYWRNGQSSQNGNEYWRNGQSSQNGNEYWRNGQSSQKDGAYWQNNQNSYHQYQTVNWVPYLIAAIFSTVCCCIPFGVVAIIYAVKINSDITAGQYDAAVESARNARMWCIISIAVGVVLNFMSCSLAMSLW